jgi:hypothetical protein
VTTSRNDEIPKSKSQALGKPTNSQNTILTEDHADNTDVMNTGKSIKRTL